MAMSCAHCRSGDVAVLFDSFQCFNCGGHTTTDGRTILPDSMCFAPNVDDAVAQFGWPLADSAPTVDRGAVICAEQWGMPLKESA